MSKFSVDVLPIKLEPHPNADALSIVKVGGFTVCVKTADWQDGQLAAYVPPDSVVDSALPEFAFLAGHEHVKVRKFRGVYSQGLLVPAPEGSHPGEDVAGRLHVTHYEPPLLVQGADAERGPEDGLPRPVYDVENFNKFPNILVPGEEVFITEKIHGTNARYTYANDRFYCGSRTRWVKEGDNVYWAALRQCDGLQEYLKINAGDTVYGEVYGRVQSLKYGLPQSVAFRAFDILMPDGSYLDAGGFLTLYGILEAWHIPHVPILDRGPFDEARARKLAEGKSTLPNAEHVREGVVIRPYEERWHEDIGRVQLKIIGNGYLEKY